MAVASIDLIPLSPSSWLDGWQATSLRRLSPTAKTAVFWVSSSKSSETISSGSIKLSPNNCDCWDLTHFSETYWNTLSQMLNEIQWLIWFWSGLLLQWLVEWVVKTGFFWTISPKLKGIKLKIFLKTQRKFPKKLKVPEGFPWIFSKTQGIGGFCSVKSLSSNLIIQKKIKSLPL